MSPLLTIIIIVWLAGFTAFVGGVFASLEGSAETTVKKELVHGVIAFAGGILLAAVAFALVPEGMEELSPNALAVSLLGPAAAVTGYLFLGQYPNLTTSMMSAAAGGILYLIFQDIAPQSKLRRHWTLPLGAVLGFAMSKVVQHVLD